MVEGCGQARGKVVAASPTAQALALAAKHLGKDPYELYNHGRRLRYCEACGRERAHGDDQQFCRGRTVIRWGRETPDDHPARAWTLAAFPPHPRPRSYTNLLLAMASWVEGEQMTVDAMKIQAASLGGMSFKALGQG